MPRVWLLRCHVYVRGGVLMSRRKLEYEFLPFPATLHPLWSGCTNAMLGLCVRLFRLSKGHAVRVYGQDWKESVCKQMELHGRERPATRKLLSMLHSDGIITVVGDNVTIRFHPDVQDEPSEEGSVAPDEYALVVEGFAVGLLGENSLELNARNHSSENLQSREIREEKRENAQARETPAAPPKQVGETKSATKAEVPRGWLGYQKAFIAAYNSWNADSPRPGVSLDSLSLAGRSSEFMALEQLSESFAAQLDRDLGPAKPYDRHEVFVAVCDTFFDAQTRKKDPAPGEARWLARDWKRHADSVLEAMRAERSALRGAA